MGLKNVMLGETVDIKVINLLKSLAKALGFEDTLFVSSAGDNSDGSSWIKAYTSLTTALDWIASNQSSGQFHLIVTGVGSFDIDTTGNPTYDENIAIVGMGRNLTTITNSNSGATCILKFTGSAILSNLKIDVGATSIDGILVNGTGANGFEAENVHFEGDTATGAMDLLMLDGGVKYPKIRDCFFHGVVTNTTGIHLDDCTDGLFKDNEVDDCLIGIHLDNADDDDNHFEIFEIDDCVMGIQIDNAGSTGNAFFHIYLYGCTANIDDNGTSTELFDINADSLNATLAPADLTGVVVTAAAGANNWTVADVEIRNVAAATKPFYVTGVVFEFDTLEKWGIRLTKDGGTTYFWDGILEAAANRSNRILFNERYLVSQGTAIECSVKSETGGNDADIWINIEVI